MLEAVSAENRAVLIWLEADAGWQLLALLTFPCLSSSTSPPLRLNSTSYSSTRPSPRPGGWERTWDSECQRCSQALFSLGVPTPSPWHGWERCRSSGWESETWPLDQSSPFPSSSLSLSFSSSAWLRDLEGQVCEHQGRESCHVLAQAQRGLCGTWWRRVEFNSCLELCGCHKITFEHEPRKMLGITVGVWV